MKSVQATILSLCIFFIPVTSLARNIMLNCTDSVNLYSDPYLVEIDRKSSLVVIKHHLLNSGIENKDYQITNVEGDSGSYTITADGKIFNSHIILQIHDDISIQYTDAFTDRPLAVDRCTSARGSNSKN